MITLTLAPKTGASSSTTRTTFTSGKWGRTIDTDQAAGRWLLAMDFGAVIELKREHFCFAPH